MFVIKVTDFDNQRTGVDGCSYFGHMYVPKDGIVIKVTEVAKAKTFDSYNEAEIYIADNKVKYAEVVEVNEDLTTKPNMDFDYEREYWK